VYRHKFKKKPYINIYIYGIYIKTDKDQLSFGFCCEVVYKINCQNCEASYVDQTKRSLKTRVKEHFVDIRRSSGSLSVVSDHRLTFNYDFDW